MAEVPKKKRKLCIIHCTEDDSKLIAPRDIASWQSLLSAAKLLKNTDILGISTVDGEVPDHVFYHRKCRQVILSRLCNNLISRCIIKMMPNDCTNHDG